MGFLEGQKFEGDGRGEVGKKRGTHTGRHSMSDIYKYNKHVPYIVQ